MLERDAEASGRTDGGELLLDNHLLGVRLRVKLLKRITMSAMRRVSAAVGMPCVLLGASLLCAADGLEERPDPIHLLEAVYTAREQIPPSRLKVSDRARNQGEQSWHEALLAVYFEHRKYRVDELRPDNSGVRTLFDGAQVIQLDSNRDVVLRDRVQHATSDPFYDVRVLGINLMDTWAAAFTGVPDFRSFGRNYKTVGWEMIRGVGVWHVQETAPSEYDLKVDYWIEPGTGFRVHRYAYSIVGERPSTVESYYENSTYPWLPSRVESKIYTGDVFWERELVVQEGLTMKRLPEETWTIAGLKPPLNATVTDYRLQQILGYWDGQGVRDVPVPARGKRGVGVVALGVMLLLVVAPLVWLVRSRRRLGVS